MKKYNFTGKVALAAVAASCAFTVAQAQEIATWAGFRTAAANFTFDDGAPSHVSDAGPLFDKYGYKATFNVVVNWNPNWSGFQNMAKNGHEIASHSNTHGQNMQGEEASSKQAIQSKITQDYGCLVVAYPNCNVPSQSAVNQNYIAGRICNGSWQGGSDIMGKNGPNDWTKVSAIMTGSEGSIKSTNDFTGQMQKAIQQGGWVAFLTHGFSGKNNGNATYSPTDISAIEGALQWAKQNDSKIWVTTMRSTVMYIKERNASKIEAVSSAAAGTMAFKLTHNIADNVSKYDYPLSIRVKNSNNWTKVSAMQGSKAIDASISDGYIYFDAVPNGGDIVLSSDGAAVTPGSSSSETPASSSSAAEAKPFKGAIAVPGTVEAENYDVNAFSHSNPENEAPDYRSDNAGIVKGASGYAVGYTTAGDYFEYTLDVKSAGKYKVAVNGATGNASAGTVTVAVGSSSTDVTVKNLGDWDTYSESEGDEIQLAAGKQTLRLTINNDNLNVDWIKLTGDGTANPVVTPGENQGQEPGNVPGGDDGTAIKPIRLEVASGMVKCQVFDMNGQLVKSVNVAAGATREVWNRAQAGLSAGMYIMRYGQAGKAMQTVRVRK
ncbi:MAG: carbohydrate-binding protein [Fibrobacter sp.]|nr:carbohydrate-binding protein [Fibrobacter sp.]